MSSAIPFRDLNVINLISNYNIENDKYRDNLLFIMGINLGLRITDLLQLKFSDIINDDSTFKDAVRIEDRELKGTSRKNRVLTIPINKYIMNSVLLYLRQSSNIYLDEYIFKNVSRNAIKNDANIVEPMTVQSANRIMKYAINALDLQGVYSSKSFRKTFAYHYILQNANDNESLELLFQLLGHRTIYQTMMYIGMSNDEFESYKLYNKNKVEAPIEPKIDSIYKYSHRKSEEVHLLIDINTLNNSYLEKKVKQERKTKITLKNSDNEISALLKSDDFDPLMFLPADERELIINYRKEKESKKINDAERIFKDELFNNDEATIEQPYELVSERVITNNIFVCNFTQNDYECEHYEIYFVNKIGERISDSVFSNKCKCGEHFKLSFSLYADYQFEKKDSVYCIIKNADTNLLIGKFDFKVDIAFAAIDFGF